MDEQTKQDTDRVAGRLKFYFAVLSCLGGLVLASGTDTNTVTVIAVFFAIFGYLFVDWLELFALPPVAAYAAMGLAALYCVSDFIEIDSPGNHQMVAVAQLLVFVQAILMLQKKTRRILEQLGVFCLLELIVAAVFNNAISYGLLLIPIGIVGAWALSLMAALSAAEGMTSIGELDDESEASSSPSSRFFGRTPTRSGISVVSPESAQSLAATALRLPRIAMFTLAPAVILVATIFFYALPRTTDAAKGTNQGNALVGFSDELRLDQIGQMQQSSAIAMRVFLTDRTDGKPYRVNNGIYLRGRVLERYRSSIIRRRPTATWTAIPETQAESAAFLPPEFISRRTTDTNFFDAIQVRVSCEASRSPALFAIAPYYRDRTNSDVLHSPQRWTLAQRQKGQRRYPRTAYRFGTHALHNGEQTDLIACPEPIAIGKAEDSEASRWSIAQAIKRRSQQQRAAEIYRDELLTFDVDAMPTADRLAKRLTQGPSGNRESAYRAAKRMENYLASSGQFKYTLNLDAEPVPGLDPIEQFLSVSRRGHCQFFASALVMMLRSQDIPARVVVGYQTDEFSELGNHYTARQLHAHAWVEALIDESDLSQNRIVYGQQSAKEYWLRLDPTPGAARIRTPAGGVGQVLDLAQNIWDDYVVEMDGETQKEGLLGRPTANPMNRSYERFVEGLSNLVRNVRAGQLGGGSLAGRNLFSWPAAVLGVALAIASVLLVRIRPPAWLKRRMSRREGTGVDRPSVGFYANTIDQLQRAGVSRAANQTPAELATEASTQLQHPLVPSIQEPLSVLTRSFYQVRFGHQSDPFSESPEHLDRVDGIEHARKADDGAETDEAGPSDHDGAGTDRRDEIQQALDNLTRSVDLMTIEPATRDAPS